RTLNSTDLLFRIPLKPKESVTLYFQITTDPRIYNPTLVRAEALSQDTWIEFEQNRWLLNGLIGGLIIIATIFSLLNFIYGRKLYLFSLLLSNVIILYYVFDSNNILSAYFFTNDMFYRIARNSLIYFCLPAFVASTG